MTTTNVQSLAAGNGRRWPEGWSERHAEYVNRRRTYLGLAYTLGDMQRLGLFQATDTAGRVVHETRRIIRDPAFVADVNASALANGISLGVRADAFPDMGAGIGAAEAVALDAGLAVWHRSRIDDVSERWGRMTAVYGDLHLEVVTDASGDPMLVAHKPQNVKVYYDPNGVELDAAVIEFRYSGPPGADGQTPVVAYRRTLTRESVRVEVDGKVESDAPHTLGVVPLVHVPFRPLDEPEFSLCAFSGLEDPTAVADSAMTQLAVIGGRHASPWLKVIGAILDGGGDPATLGKILNIPTDADVDWLVAPLDGLGALVEQVRALREAVTQTCPEFLFIDAGANASGTSLSYRAGAYKAKVEPAQRRFRGGVARGIGMAVAYARGVPFTDAVDIYDVDGPPALPEDRAAILALYRDAMDAGALKLRDLVARLQASGVVPPGVPAEEYAAEAAAEAQARNAEIVTLANRMGEQPQPPAAQPVEPDADELL